MVSHRGKSFPPAGSIIWRYILDPMQDFPTSGIPDAKGNCDTMKHMTLKTDALHDCDEHDQREWLEEMEQWTHDLDYEIASHKRFHSNMTPRHKAVSQPMFQEAPNDPSVRPQTVRF